MRAFFAVRVPAACFVMPFAVPFAICSLCRSLCRSCRADSQIQIEREDFPRWIFMAPFLLKTRKAKDSSRRSLMVISGRMLRQLVGDQVVTSESSRPAACFAMPFVRTGLTLEIEQEDFPAEWMIYGTVLATKYTRMVTVGGHLWKNAQASLFVRDRLATPESSRPTGVTNGCHG